MIITKQTVDDRFRDSVGQWLKTGTIIYVAISNYEERGMVKDAGFRWNPLFKKWFVNDINRAAKLSEYADPSCRDELDAVRKQNFQSLQASRCISTDIDFPHPEGLSYYPFQKAGIAFCLNIFNS